MGRWAWWHGAHGRARPWGDGLRRGARLLRAMPGDAGHVCRYLGRELACRACLGWGGWVRLGQQGPQADLPWWTSILGQQGPHADLPWWTSILGQQGPQPDLMAALQSAPPPHLLDRGQCRAWHAGVRQRSGAKAVPHLIEPAHGHQYPQRQRCSFLPQP